MNERLEFTTKTPVLEPVTSRAMRASSRGRILLPVAAAFALVFGLNGCAKRRADAAPIAPPVAIKTSPPAIERPPGPLSEPQTRTELPPPQAVPEGAAPDPRGPFAYEAPEEPAESAQPRPPRATASAGAIPESPSAPVSSPSESSAPAQVPQLGPLISDQQREAYEREINRNSEQANAALDILMDRRLTADQVEGVRRIREFLRQAEDSRETDAALARNLSERARLLADDLVRNTR